MLRKIALFTLLLPLCLIGSSYSAAQDIKPLPTVDENNQPIQWIDKDILDKLNAIKPQKSYKLYDLYSILPKSGNFPVWIEGEVTKVYAAPSRQAFDKVFGKNAVVDSTLKGDEPMYVVESVSKKRVPIPSMPGSPVKYAKQQVMQTIINIETGNAVSTQTRYEP